MSARGGKPASSWDPPPGDWLAKQGGGENKDWIFAVGNARPLDQAVQHATTEMLRWLQQDYGLDALGANLLLAQCVRYDLGNMFDPAYTMVCKVPREFLPTTGSSGD